MKTQAQRVDFYVSPTGDDGWTGRSPEPLGSGNEGPFATLSRARDAIRAIRASTPSGGSTAVTVWLRGGIYTLRESVSFGPEDSGTPDAPVLYRAYRDELVRLTGGQQLSPSAFEPVTDPAIRQRFVPTARDHVRQIDLRACGVTDLGSLSSRGFGRPTIAAHLELFFNDRPMTVAQWPDAGKFATITGFTKPMIDEWGRENGDLTGGFTYAGDRPQSWAPSDDIWVHGYWAYDWANSYERVQHLDAAARIVQPAPPGGNYHFAKDQRFYFLNVLEELDQPGETYVDRQSSILYFWPPEPLEGAELLISILSEPLLKLEGASHLQFRGLVIEVGRGNGVAINGGEGVTLAGCTLRNFGNWAVTIEGGLGHMISGCDIYGTGDGGIRINGGDRATLRPCNHTVLNNHIHHYARWTRTYAAGVSASGVGMRIAQNLIHDAPHNAILFWGNDFTIEANEIYRVCLETGDAGAIYTGRDFTFRGNVIRRNLIHHMGGVGMGSIAIYMDDCVSGTHIAENVLQQCQYGLMLGGGRDFVVENNIFVDCYPSIHADARGVDLNPVWQAMVNRTMRDSLAAMHHHESPYHDRYPEIATVDRHYAVGAGVPPEHNRVERNLCCRGRWIDPVWPKGVDNGIAEKDNLVSDDLGFVDEEFGDFALRCGAHALALGFRPIPMGQIGLRCDGDRLALPPHIHAALRLLNTPEVGEVAKVTILLRNVAASPARGTALVEVMEGRDVKLAGPERIPFQLDAGQTASYDLNAAAGPGRLILQVVSPDSWFHPARLTILYPHPLQTTGTAQQEEGPTKDSQGLGELLREFHGNGFFPWQFSSENQKQRWAEWHYDEAKYWGGFSHEPFDPTTYRLPDWAIGPFEKHPGNPVFAPNPDGWDCGHFGGGVHNGSILKREGQLYFVYRGEFPLPDEPRFASRRQTGIDYLCDIGLAVSDDGIAFRRVAGPLLRRPEDWMFSFEDVNCVQHEGRYYMFLNRWDWERINDPSVCGVYLAVSDDLVHWEHRGLVFPHATRIHRNGTVLQDPNNCAVRDARGRFVMYINDRLIAYSDDLLHWESRELSAIWPGGECAVAFAHYHPTNDDHVMLMTGGNHTGHFYAKGEVLFSLQDPETPLEWLPRPVLAADARIPYEDGYSAEPPHRPISYWRDTVFLCGMTAFQGQWVAYYGGSEYYTCLATAPYRAGG